MANTKWLKGLIVVLIILVFTKSGTSCASSETIRASAIAGWHLIVPPFVPGDPPGPLQLRAPLSHWFETDLSETAVDCAEQRDNMRRMYRSADITSTAIQFELLLYHYAVCVSSADPRLAPSQRTAAQSFARLPEANLVATGYAGPPIQRGSDESADYHSGLALEADKSDMQIAVPMMLLTLMLMTTGGSVGGWLLEPGRGRRDAHQEPQQCCPQVI
jgi:hypothetical protein